MLNAGIEWLERRDVLQPHRADDMIQVLAESVWERDGDTWRTSAYARSNFAQESFSETKTEGPRVFVLGGSWAMGTPWINNGDLPQPGSMGWFLEAGLEDWLQGSAEVINGGAGAQDSNRVRAVALEALKHQPDALFVATCNNEGALPPDAARAWLSQQGGYRLLQRLLAGTREPDRSMFTAWSAPVKEVARRYEENLRAIITAAEKQGVPVALATLPVNLGYRGIDPGHPVSAHKVAVSTPPSLPEGLHPPQDLEGVPDCVAGMLLFELEEYEAALGAMTGCFAGEPLPSTPLIGAMLLLQQGLNLAEARTLLRTRWEPCIVEGLELYWQGQATKAREQLSKCEDVSEALRWIGLATLQEGDASSAKRLLRQSVELRPRNRCRPSFNEIVRRIAAEKDHVYLVDLERAAEDISAHGIPGSTLFLDSCHMTWQGYGAMAAAALSVMGPMLGLPAGEPLNVDELGHRAGLPRAVRAQIAAAYGGSRPLAKP